MGFWTTLKFAARSRPLLLLALDKNLRGLFRSGFLSALLAEGLHEPMLAGPATLEQLRQVLGPDADGEALRRWLDVGVSLGELRRGEGDTYALAGALARALSEAPADALRAFLQVRVDVFQEYVLRTPARLRRGERFPLDPAHGELFARSSRAVEPLLWEVVDREIPRHGPLRLLEVGCGSGAYLRRACERNADLTAVGIELTEQVAAHARANLAGWGLGDRVAVETCDVRRYRAEPPFDIATFHNLIYYFPIAERVTVLRHLAAQLVAGGRLILTTFCRGTGPSNATFDLWAAMTEGGGPLPTRDELLSAIEGAGFIEPRAEQLLPAYFLVTARTGALAAPR